MNYFIVDSVKGGCGKSTIALWKAINLKLQGQEKSKVCYVDLDILGTSMEKFIGCRKDPNTVYLNDLFAGERNAVKKKKVTTSLNFKVEEIGDKNSFILDESEEAVRISAIFCSPKQKDKNLFRPNYLTGGQCIDYTFFALRMKELFEELKDGGYTDIVIDMPPNSDPYTDSVFDLLLHRTSSSSPAKDWTVKLLLISSFDRPNIQANVNWFQEICNKDHDWYPFDKVECYFNDVRGCFSKSDITLGTEMKPLPSMKPGEKPESSEVHSDCEFIIGGHVKRMLVDIKNVETQVFTVGYSEMLSLSAIISEGPSVVDRMFNVNQRLILDLNVSQINKQEFATLTN